MNACEHPESRGGFFRPGERRGRRGRKSSHEPAEIPDLSALSAHSAVSSKNLRPSASICGSSSVVDADDNVFGLTVTFLLQSVLGERRRVFSQEVPNVPTISPASLRVRRRPMM